MRLCPWAVFKIIDVNQWELVARYAKKPDAEAFMGLVSQFSSIQYGVFYDVTTEREAYRTANSPLRR